VNLISEYALLFVVALPVALILAMNLVLFLEGESGTLLFPSRAPFPAIPMDEIDVTPALTSSAVALEAANDEMRTAA
jgi:hypothetical protein